MLKALFNCFSSLKLTVACLVLGCVIVFWGTIAQVHLGLYKAQNEFFRSFFVYWTPAGSGFHIPIFPGGYFIGTVLLINLFVRALPLLSARQTKNRHRADSSRRRAAAARADAHGFPVPGKRLHLRIGETKNYSEADRAFELAVFDTTDQDSDKVVAIPCSLLVRRGEVSDPEMPFTVRVKTFYANSLLAQQSQPGYEPVKTTAGLGSGIWWREVPRETEMNRMDMPSAIVEIATPQGSLGTFLVSAWLDQPQPFTFNDRSYELLLRQERYYLPFSLHLIEFRHDKYPGTDIPKNFSSRVRLQNLENGEDREVRIFMNNPLRYARRNVLSGELRPRRPRQRAAGGAQSELADAVFLVRAGGRRPASSSSSAT